jgi:hypothetical protein
LAFFISEIGRLMHRSESPPGASSHQPLMLSLIVHRRVYQQPMLSSGNVLKPFSTYARLIGAAERG